MTMPLLPTNARSPRSVGVSSSATSFIRHPFLWGLCIFLIGWKVGQLSDTSSSSSTSRTLSFETTVVSKQQVLHEQEVQEEEEPGEEPFTIESGQRQIVDLLTRIWDLEDDRSFMKVKAKEGTIARFFTDLFIREAIEGLGEHFGPTCMDWGDRYMKTIPNCKIQYMYEYSPTETKYVAPVMNDKTHQMQEPGYIQGDLADDMSHVPDGLLTGALVTQVFEHVNHPWLAAANLYRIVAPGGALLFTIPFLYNYHLVPGDFYRYTPMGAIHLLESAGFICCQLSTNGFRAAQIHALGLPASAIDTKYITKKSPPFAIKHGGTDYNFIFQKPSSPDQTTCTLPRVELTNELQRQQVQNDFWPEKMENFPFGKFESKDGKFVLMEKYQKVKKN